MKDREKVRKGVREVYRGYCAEEIVAGICHWIPEASFPPVSLIPAANLQPVSPTPVVNVNIRKDFTTGVVDTGGAPLLEKFCRNFRNSSEWRC